VPDAVGMTAADIARLAGVTRATVSNWRRRHPDFPLPRGGTEASPAYDREEVEAWLAARGVLPELPLGERLWRRVADIAGGADLDAVTWAVAAAQADARSCSLQAPPARFMVADSGRKWEDLARDLAGAAAKCGWQDIVTALIGKYIEETGRSSLATPSPVADLMTRLGEIRGKTVLDPACGTGELLVSAAGYGAARVLGQDTDASLTRLAQLRLEEFFQAVKVEVKAGDSLHDDQFASVQADVVLCHPPFGNRNWGHDELAYDPRWQFGTPPRAESELAWVQHAVARLLPGGRAVMLMPPAAASRPSGRRIRAEMLRRGTIRAVASLPAGAVYPRHVAVHLWVLERPAAESHPDPRMLFIDTAADMVETGDVKRPSARWEQACRTVVEAWDSFTADGGTREPGTWRAVPVIDLLDEEVDLSPSRHVGVPQVPQSPAEIAEAVRAARTNLRDALAVLGEALPGDGWTPRHRQDRWRDVSMADLARSGAIAVHRASSAAPADDALVDDLDPDDGWPVLTLGAVLRGNPPTEAEPGGGGEPGWIKIRAGDVILPAMAASPVRARVAEGEDEEAILGRNLHLIRPDPGRIDPWFLSGFLTSTGNIQQASYGSTVTRIDVRRLTVPLLPLQEQQRYGRAFRELHEFGMTSQQLTRLVEKATTILRRGLAEGLLCPPEPARGRDRETGPHDGAAPLVNGAGDGAAQVTGRNSGRGRALIFAKRY
jgi:SAM-dependent methyltransferase